MIYCIEYSSVTKYWMNSIELGVIHILKEKTTRLSLTGAIVILSLVILISAFQISSAIRDASNIETNVSDEQNRYELISANESNIIIFDKQSGEYWRKFVETNEGPTEWEKQLSPIVKSGN